MSTPEGLAFEPFVDDGGNIGIRLNQEVVVYMPEEQAQIRAEFERLATENAKLRELVGHLDECRRHVICGLCPYNVDREKCDFDAVMGELGIGVDA